MQLYLENQLTMDAIVDAICLIKQEEHKKLKRIEELKKKQRKEYSASKEPEFNLKKAKKEYLAAIGKEGLRKVLETCVESEFIYHLYDSSVNNLLGKTQKIADVLDRSSYEK